MNRNMVVSGSYFRPYLCFVHYPEVRALRGTVDIVGIPYRKRSDV
jgi:hypothetical protein